jgi:polyphosphate:AMP phosphotransferase
MQQGIALLDKLDLTKSLTEDEYEEIVLPLKNKLARLQRDAREAGIPVMVIFEGLNTIGLGSLVNEFILPLDPRGFTYHYVGAPDLSEVERPFMWRFWMMTPARGRIAILDRSYYSRALLDKCRVDGSTLDTCAEAFRWFEGQLLADGAVIVKLFIHMGQEEQLKRMGDPGIKEMLSCGFLEQDLELQENWEQYLPLFERLIEETDTGRAPWTIVEANDRRYAVARVLSAITEALERGLEDRSEEVKEENGHGTFAITSVRTNLDLSKELSKEAYEMRVASLQSELRYIQCELHKRRVPLIVLFEGWDAAGKGGDIRRLTQNLNPRTYHVVPIYTPTKEEKAHHYLMRFMDDIPRKGHITIFDRSWYGRVLVERVEGFASLRDWKRAYREINEFEDMLAQDGAILIKFWLEIDRKEQLKRFKQREGDPDKRWKITEDDWRNRKLWDDYSIAVDEMLLRTSTTYAPWTIVESNDKRYSRVKVMETVADTVKEALRLE